MLPLGPQPAGVLSFAVTCGGPGRSVDSSTIRPLVAGSGSSFCGKSAGNTLNKMTKRSSAPSSVSQTDREPLVNEEREDNEEITDSSSIHRT